MPLRSLYTSFTDHPASVGESYGQHLAQASSFGFRMMIGGCACLLHGLFPFLFVKTGSEQVKVLHMRMVTHRRRDDRMPHDHGGRVPMRLSQDEGAPIDFVI